MPIILGGGGENLFLDQIISCTYGCWSRSATDGKPFLHASVVNIDSNTDPEKNTLKNIHSFILQWPNLIQAFKYVDNIISGLQNNF